MHLLTISKSIFKNQNQLSLFKSILTSSVFNFATFKKRILVSSEQHQKIPDIPQDLILSKFLKTLPSKKEQQINSKIIQQEQQLPKLDLNNKNKWSYKTSMNKNPYGSIKSFSYKDFDFTLISTNYHRSNPLNLIQIFTKSNPQILFLQIRPQTFKKFIFNKNFNESSHKQQIKNIFNKFQLIPKNDKGIFSDTKYLNQLIIQPQQIQQLSIFRIIKEYFEWLLSNRRNKRIKSSYQQNQLYSILSKTVNQNQLVNGIAICASLYYAYRYSKRIIIGQMPMDVNRQWVANNNTLMELQQIFKVTNHMIPRYKNLAITPYQLATLLYPDTFLSDNDVYMTTLLEMAIAKLYKESKSQNHSQNRKKIVGVFHLMQNQAITQLLHQNIISQEIDPIISKLIPKAPQSSIIKNITPWEIIQKHILFDVLYYGQSIANISLRQFRTTNQIIDFYLENNESPQNQKIIMEFRQDKIYQYLKLLVQKRSQGKQEMNKQFVRQAIRENKRTTLL